MQLVSDGTRICALTVGIQGPLALTSQVLRVLQGQSWAWLPQETFLHLCLHCLFSHLFLSDCRPGEAGIKSLFFPFFCDHPVVKLLEKGLLLITRQMRKEWAWGSV